MPKVLSCSKFAVTAKHNLECCDNIEHLMISSIIKTSLRKPKSRCSLMSRNDVDVASQKINELLKELCLKHGHTIIDNENLDATCLNG